MKKLNNYSKIQKKNNKNCNRANIYNTISTLFSSTNVIEKIPDNCANQNNKFVKNTDNIMDLLVSNISSESEDNSSGRLIYNNIFFKKNNSDNSILSDSIIKNTIEKNISVNNENILDHEHLIKNLNNTFIIISNLLKNLFIIAIKFFNNMLLFIQSQLLEKNNNSQNIKISKKKKYITHL